MISFSEVEKICEQIANKANVNPDNVSIDLQIKGYISYIEVGGIKKYTGQHKPSIIESLNSLSKNILA